MKPTSLLIALGAFLSLTAFAGDQIIRPYQSVRSSGMGGVKLSTGLYDENFFGNPARVLANPRSRATLFDLAAEVSASSIGHVGDIASSTGDEIYAELGNTAGDNNHVRVQTTIPSLYIPAGEGKSAYAFGLIMSTQGDINLRRSFQVDPTFFVDVGPAITYGRKFLENDALSVGATLHGTYRLATSQPFTFVDLIRGTAISAETIGGQGAHVDLDLGATYELPLELLGAKWTAAAAMNNTLGGGYSNLGLKLVDDVNGAAPAQPRTLGFGAAARWEQLGPFTEVVAALEMTDIGNNPNGGMFRLIHAGAEGRYGVIKPRLGINQGYLAAGLGLDLRFFMLDLATYGEELSLNPGGLQDRRFALKIAFQI